MATKDSQPPGRELARKIGAKTKRWIVDWYNAINYSDSGHVTWVSNLIQLWPAATPHPVFSST